MPHGHWTARSNGHTAAQLPHLPRGNVVDAGSVVAPRENLLRDIRHHPHGVEAPPGRQGFEVGELAIVLCSIVVSPRIDSPPLMKTAQRPVEGSRSSRDRGSIPTEKNTRRSFLTCSPLRRPTASRSVRCSSIWWGGALRRNAASSER
ncbi:hypothetical protein AKJ09_11052 [Labilithrix luteola]|uniref:Uncharacterized protein n=1 Tax=Labilithrix luteola TaxID=1391654 RepID=A0A0K1QF50_9BACT|nr:hypothetical protein AKJ09_11052 [Labilithrix luteola]